MSVALGTVLGTALGAAAARSASQRAGSSTGSGTSAKSSGGWQQSARMNMYDNSVPQTSGIFDTGWANQMSSFMDQIYGLTDRNNALSEQRAAELRDWQERQNQIAMEFNSAEAQKNRDWQEMMSNTAHQREVADLQAAGLNPILSASGGNGAAVTSGATASGVTSAGAKGDVDTQATSALVQLLGTMWMAQTQLEMQRMSAQTNLTIAEKNNSTSEMIAQMYTQQAREASELASATGLQQSQISAAVQELVARIHADANYYSADMSYRNALVYSNAQKVVAQMQVEGQYRTALLNGIVDLAQTSLNYDAAIRGQDMSYNSASDVAKIYAAASRYGADKASSATRYSADKHSNAQVVSSAVNGLFGTANSILRTLPFLG